MTGIYLIEASINIRKNLLYPLQKKEQKMNMKISLSVVEHINQDSEFQ